MGFKLYQPKKGGKSKNETISISPSGRIGISRLCYERRFQGAEYAELYYNPQSQQIGIKPKIEASEYTFKIPVGSNRKQAITINGLGLFKINQIEIKDLKRYTPTWHEKEKMLIVQLT